MQNPASKRIPRSFWKRALEDVNPRGNTYLGLFSKKDDAWVGRMAEFPDLVATGKTLKLVTKALAKKLMVRCESIDQLCDANQNADGIILGLSPKGQTAIWIGRMLKPK